jgi:hypothetical protein
MPTEAAPAVASMMSKMRRSPTTIAGARPRQSELAARDGVRRILRLDSARVGRVDPDEASLLVAHPHRVGNRIEHRPQGPQFSARTRLQLQQAGGLNAIGADILDPHHRVAGDGTAFDVKTPAVKARDRAAKRLAPGPQPVDELGEQLRLVRLDPCVEGGRATGRGHRSEQAGIAGDVRLDAGTAPDDDDLRFHGGQKFRAIEAAQEGGDLGGALVLPARPSPAGRQVAKRGQR